MNHWPRLLSALLLLLLSHPAQASEPPLQATVEVNRVHCLTRFVDVLAGNGGGYAGTRHYFEQSRFNTAPAQHWLARYRALDRTPGYQREGYPAERLAAQASIETPYLTATADAADLPDLLRRTAGLLPNEVLLGLDSIYRYFDPIYDTLLWLPQHAALEEQRQRYTDFLAQRTLLGHFSPLRTFYGSVWPTAVPYRILLNPQPPDQKRAFTNHAWVSGNLVLLDCRPTSRDFVEGSTIVFHEMCHSLSMQQRRDLQIKIDGWYRRQPSPNRRYAYTLMEEAFATAASEWLHEQVAGRVDSGEWYNDLYIDRYAHALYPLIRRYVSAGQTLDSAFVTQAVQTFDQTFPSAATDYVNLFRKVLYWTDAADHHAALLPFQEQFNSTLTMTAVPILGEQETLDAARKGEFTPVIIVTQQHAATLKYLQRQLPALKGQRLPADKDFVLATTGVAGPVVVISVREVKRLAAVAQWLHEQGKIDPSHALHELP